MVLLSRIACLTADWESNCQLLSLGLLNWRYFTSQVLAIKS